MQRPTCTEVRIKTVADAHVVFYGVSLGYLPMVNRRLDSEERRNLKAGDVYVWEERGPDAEATGLGIERWTDGIRWGPSRVRDEFLFYHEKDSSDMDLNLVGPFNLRLPAGTYYGRREKLIKQTYSVFVDSGERRRKWHMIAYFTQETANTLYSVRDITALASLSVPPGTFRSARSAKGRPRPLEQTMHTVDTGRHPSPKRSSPVSAPYTYTRRQSPLPPWSASSSPSSLSASRQVAIPDRAQGFDAVAHQPPQPYEPPVVESDFSWLQASPPVDTTSNSADTLAPLAYLEHSHIPKRHPVDDRALRAFSVSP